MTEQKQIPLALKRNVKHKHLHIYVNSKKPEDVTFSTFHFMTCQ